MVVQINAALSFVSVAQRLFKEPMPFRSPSHGSLDSMCKGLIKATPHTAALADPFAQPSGQRLQIAHSGARLCTRHAKIPHAASRTAVV